MNRNLLLNIFIAVSIVSLSYGYSQYRRAEDLVRANDGMKVANEQLKAVNGQLKDLVDKFRIEAEHQRNEALRQRVIAEQNAAEAIQQKMIADHLKKTK